MDASRPIGIDLFSGAGGLSLGFEQAGFDIVAAVELDPVHAAAHHFNFPQCATIPLSVSDLSAADIRREAGLQDREPVQVVFGGAPCQGFSLIGQRALDDPRNSLVRDFIRLVIELKAQYFVFENVKGLTLGKHRKFLQEFVDSFADAGYQVRLPWKVLNAAHYGVPQHRERLFLLGARNGLQVPKYPPPTTAIPPRVNGLPAAPTCEAALADLPEAEAFEELLRSDSVVTESWGEPSPYASFLRCEDTADWGYAYRRRWDRRKLTSSSRTNHTDISRRRFAATDPGSVEPVSRFFKLPPNGLSNTLRAGTDSARGAFTSPRPIHYETPRCVTVREMARLHGFPDWFRFHETKWHGARQVGNAVPPPLARAVAQAVIDALGFTPTCPDEPLDAGDEALLTMSVQQAADFWSVPNPIGKRNMKSGARKRKQEDIEDVT